MKLAESNLGSSQKLFSAMLESHAIDESFAALLKINPQIPAKVALGIYRNNTIGTRKRALQAIYPVVEKILGDTCFDMLASDFVNASASVDSDLNHYGAGFSVFIQKLVKRESAFSALPYLNDLAALEWLVHQAYYVADDLPVSENMTTDVDISVKLKRSYALYYMSSLFPVYDIWQNHQRNCGVEDVAALTDEDFILVFRQRGLPVVEQLDKEEWSILQSIEGQIELSEVVDKALIDGVDIEQKLPAMIERGWLSLV